ncbi:MAG: hypothetical protein AAF656_10240, partial [Planctomycetota bacterium]
MLGDTAYFTTDRGLYRTDGTADGTELLLNAGKYGGSVHGITAASGGTYLATEDGSRYTLRFVQDNGSVSVIGDMTDPGVWRGAVLGDTLVFMGAERTMLDRATTTAGSITALDVAGLTGFDGQSEMWFKAVGDQVYFSAEAGSGDPFVWRTDGTSQNTKNTGLRSRWEPDLIGGDLFFNTGDFGAVRMDLATEQTFRLNPFPRPDGAGQNVVTLGGELYFISDEELWRSNGDAGDAVRVANTDTLWQDGNPAVVGGKLFVPGNIGVASGTFDRELWAYDPVNERLDPINLVPGSWGSAFGLPAANPHDLRSVNGSLYLLTEPRQSSANALLRIDPETFESEVIIDDVDRR